MRPRKLTEEQKAEIRAVIAARRAMPTNKQLAKKYGVCAQLIWLLGRRNNVPCGTSAASDGVIVTSSNIVRG